MSRAEGTSGEVCYLEKRHAVGLKCQMICHVLTVDLLVQHCEAGEGGPDCSVAVRKLRRVQM
jgi:hypothetical protein